MSPPIPPRPKVGCTIAQIGKEFHRRFGDPQALESRLDHHLACKLHSRSAETELQECSLPNCPQSRVSVADAGTEKEVEDSRENRVANVAVLPWHCAGRNAALEAGAHAKIGAITKLADHLDAVE